MSGLVMGRDAGGYNAFALPKSNFITNTTLAANVAQGFTLPITGDPNYPRWLVVIAYSVPDVFVAYNTTAAVPGASFTGFSATASEMNPVPKYLNAGDTVSFITSETGCYVSVSLYAVA